MRCSFHPHADATTLCTDCYRALCRRCATSGKSGSTCATGCHTPPFSISSTYQGSGIGTAVAGTFRGGRLSVGGWTRLGAATFFVGLVAAAIPAGVLSLAGYTASLLCISNAWLCHRKDKLSV
jgi:hypothetical protein